MLYTASTAAPLPQPGRSAPSRNRRVTQEEPIGVRFILPLPSLDSLLVEHSWESSVMVIHDKCASRASNLSEAPRLLEDLQCSGKLLKNILYGVVVDVSPQVKVDVERILYAKIMPVISEQVEMFWMKRSYCHTSKILEWTFKRSSTRTYVGFLY